MSQGGILTVEGDPTVPTSFPANIGVAIPTANSLEILGAGGITTTGIGNVVTITGTATVTWNLIAANTGLAVDNGYICIAPGGALTLSLPVISGVGDEIEVVLDGATSFTVIQGAGQQIRMGNYSTTAGVFGSLVSTSQGDAIRIVCSIPDLRWLVLSSMGNPTVI